VSHIISLIIEDSISRKFYPYLYVEIHIQAVGSRYTRYQKKIVIPQAIFQNAAQAMSWGKKRGATDFIVLKRRHNKSNIPQYIKKHWIF